MKLLTDNEIDSLPSYPWGQRQDYARAVEEAVLAKLQEQDYRRGWQPIETAPKDGSHVQLYRPEIQFVGYYGGADSGWRINAPGLPAMWPQPTHWRPLPAAPDEMTQGEKK